MGTTVADLGDAVGPRLHRARAAQALEPGLSRHVPGRRLPAQRPLVDRRPDRRRPRAVHRPARRRARSRWPRPPPTPTSTPSGGRRSTTSTSRLGARMDRFGGWWRPWHYGDAVAEYWAVREGVSIGDVSTLGKLVVSGPDVVELLERLYPCHVADIKPGRSRYALLLNERGHVMDDGMILRESETRFVLSFTSGGAANAEMWVRDWIDVWGLARPRPRPDDVARRDQRHRAARGDAAAPRRARRPAALPRPRPRRCRRRPVPRHAPVVHRRGRVRAPPPGRSLGRAVARAAGPRRGPRASGRTASRRCSGCGSRRATSSSGWTPSSTRRRAGSGWTGRSGWRSRGSSAARRSSGRRSSPDHRRWIGLHDGRPGADRGLADLVRRRDRRQRDGELDTPRCSARP